MYLGSWKIDDLVTFPVNTHTASTGAATDADSVPTYRVYEDETATPILTGSMALLDAANTVGFYSEQITLSAANGFEKGKSYTIYISATVTSVEGTLSHSLQIEAEVDSNTVSASNVSANVVQIGGDTQSATDLKDFADAGYDPATNKVQGVVLVDTATTNTDMRGTDGANTTVPDVAGTANTLIGVNGVNLSALPNQTMNITGNLSGSVGSVTAAVTTDAASRTASQADVSALGTLANQTAIEGKIDTIDTNVDEVLVDTGTTIPDQITALNNISTAEVNAEVVDAISVDTYAEPGQGDPPATAPLVDKIGYLFKSWRNKTESTATEISIYNDAGDTVDQKATVSDDGTTATKGEIGTGA